MTSGYEKSPDYGGPEPKRPGMREILFAASAIVAAAIIWWEFF